MRIAVLSRCRCSAFVLCFLLLFVGRSLASVLAIDYGTEWTKAALVKAGIPMQVILTKDSKRKEQSAIAFKNQNERVYGTDGFNLGARYPDAMFPSLKGLLAQSIESDVVKRFLREHPSIQTVEGDRSSLTFQLGEESTYTVEELVAMQLVNIKLQAEKMADENVKDLILTVPVYWTEQERKALINAAELAGMKVSSLINDGLAVAISYGTTRVFTEDPQYHLIYEMGAGSTTATVVSFTSRTVKEGKSNKTVTEISTHGTGFDRELGGNLMNSRLVGFLVDAFRSSKTGGKAKGDITASGRAYARLLKEASRVKHVLSANTDTTAAIESVHEDIDFRTKVTRGDFEDVTSDLVDRVPLPILEALNDANITLEQIESVILHGGAVRVPFVQKALEDLVGAGKIAKTVNQDEAAVMGTIFRGAQLNNQFRVRDIRSKDYSTYPIVLTSNVTLHDSKETVIFPHHTKLGNTKTLTFKTSSDIALTICYHPSTLLPADIPPLLLHATITGIPDKIAKLGGEKECHDPTVKLNLRLTDAGLVDIVSSEVQCEVREKKNFADKVKGFFGGGAKEEEEEEQVVFDGKGASEGTTADASDKVMFERGPVRVAVVDESPAYLTPDQKSASKKLMRAMDKLDRDRAAREEAHNTLEAYVYRARDFLSDDVFRRVASTQEHDSFKAKLEEISEWLFSSEHASLEQFRAKLSELTYHPAPNFEANFRDIDGPISKRKADLLARPASIENLRQNLNSSKGILELNREHLASKVGKKEKDKFDLEDDEDGESKLPPGTVQFLLDEQSIETLQGAVEEVETWLREKSAAQEELEDWEEPVLLLSEIERKSNHLQSVLRKIVMEQIKTANKTKSSSSTPTPTATASASKKAEETVEEEGTTTVTETATIIETVDAEETGPTDRKHEEL